MTIRQAMSELVKQAGENDNISTLYVVDENEHFYGAIDLKDLIIARADDSLEKPDRPVLSLCHRPGADQRLHRPHRGLRGAQPAGAERVPASWLGIITSSDVVELVDDEMGDDYAKLGGLTGEEDLNESVFRKREKASARG